MGQRITDARHLHFMREALNQAGSKDFTSQDTCLTQQVQAEIALATNEVPVGCVLVHNDQIIGRGMNDTNRSLNVCLDESSPDSAVLK